MDQQDRLALAAVGVLDARLIGGQRVQHLTIRKAIGTPYSAVAGDSVGVEPDLDPVGIMQADQHRPAPVAGDDPAVGFTQFVESLPPRLDIGTGGDGQGDRVKPG